MKQLDQASIEQVSGGSVLGVITFGTLGFWTGASLGCCMGGVGAIPGAALGVLIGAYMGTDAQPQVIIIESNTEL